MTAIPLGLTAYVRKAARNWPLFLQNMYLEKDPTNQVDGFVRLQRPGLAPFADTASGASRGLYRHDGVLGGDYFAVNGSLLSRVTGAGAHTAIGPITGLSRVVMAASPTRLLIATGSLCYSYDGTTLTTIAMPDGQDVSSVAYIDGYFILTVEGTARFYWLAPGDTDPDALNFASVENSPGFIRICVRFQDELWFFKQQSLEVWQNTGDLDAPFQRMGGRLFERGCVNKDSVATLDNALFWVGDDLIAYRGGTGPVRISDHTIEERLRIAGGASISGSAFILDGHTFYALRIDGQGTFLNDVEHPNWAQWSTHNRKEWRAVTMAQNGNQILAGDDTTGDIWRLDPTRSNDDGDELVRMVYGSVPVLGTPVPCNVVRVFCSTGWTEDVQAEPFMELNFSDDQSADFDDPWYAMSLGRAGEYGHITEARQLGVIYPPGRLFVLRCTEDVVWRLSLARMNED